MSDNVRKHLDTIKPSIEKVIDICKECIEHERSWHEFRDRVLGVIIREDRIIKMILEKE